MKRLLGEHVIGRMALRYSIQALTLICPRDISMQHFGSSASRNGPFFLILLTVEKKKEGRENLIASRMPGTPGRPRRDVASCGFKASSEPAARRFHQTTSNISRVSLHGADECLHGADIRKRVFFPLNRFDTYPISIASPLHMIA